MPRDDPTVRISVTVPASLHAELERALAEGWAPNRSRAVTDALRAWFDHRREQRLRHDAALLDVSDDDEDLDAAYEALRSQP